MATDTSALKKLLTRLIDSRDGYRDAIEHVSSPDMKMTMQSLLERRERNAEELRSYLARAGEQVDDDGSLLASAHRTFMGLRDAVTGSSEQDVLAEVVRGEKTLLDAYDDALAEAGGNDPQYAFLAEQHRSLKAAIAELEARKDLAA